MSENTFIEQLVDLMDTEAELKMDTILEDIDEWDSLSYIAFLAKLSEAGKSSVKPADVKAAKTVGDLYILAKD